MSKQITKEQEQQFLKLHSEGLTTLEICEKLEVGKSVGYRLIKKYNLKNNSKTKTFTSEEIEFVRTLYQQGYTIQHIHKTHFTNECSEWAINKLVKDITRSRGKVGAADANYFKNIDSPRKAYWLGLLFADGSVCLKTKDKPIYAIQIQLTKNDSYLLEEMAIDLGVTKEQPVKYYSSETSFGKSEYGKLSISNKQMALDLVNLGCVPRKSYNLDTFPTLPKDFVRHFIRGYFDGDGTVSISKAGHLHSGFSSTPKFLSLLMCVLKEEIGLPIKTIYNTGGESYCICYNQTESKLLYHYMYDVEDCICLSRKKEKFEKIYK